MRTRSGVLHHLGGAGVGLGVVDVCGLHEDAGIGGEGGLDAGHRPPLVYGSDEARLLADDVGARAFDDAQLAVESAAQHVLAHEAVSAGVFEGEAHPLDGERVFGTDVDETVLGTGGLGGDKHPLDDEMRVSFEEEAVHEGARVALIGVAEEVLGRASSRAEEVPLAAGGEEGAAAPAEARVVHLLDDLRGLHA